MKKKSNLIIFLTSFLLLILANLSFAEEPINPEKPILAPVENTQAARDAEPNSAHELSLLLRSDNAASLSGKLVPEDWLTFKGSIYSENLYDHGYMAWVITGTVFPTFGTDNTLFAGFRGTLGKQGQEDFAFDVGGRIGVNNLIPEAAGNTIIYAWFDLGIRDGMEVHGTFGGGGKVGKEFQVGCDLFLELYQGGGLKAWIGIADTEEKILFQVGAITTQTPIWWGMGPTTVKPNDTNTWTAFAMLSIKFN